MSQDVSHEMYVKICKKIAQLTKVIYTLNSKAEEHDNIVQALKNEQEKNIERIMLESKNKILKFKLQVQSIGEKEKEIKHLRELIEKIKSDNERLQGSLSSHLDNTSLNEKQLQSDYENKYLVLQNKLLERKREYIDLMETFESFKVKVEQQRKNLTQKHEDELQRLFKDHENKLHVVHSEKIAYVEQDKTDTLEAFDKKLDSIKKELDSDFEAKYSKLRAYYESEMKIGNEKLQQQNEEKWNSEKTKIIREYELQKSDLSNRNRYLERKLEEFEQNTESATSETKSLHNELAEYQTKCQSYEDKINEHQLRMKSAEHKNEKLTSELHDLLTQSSKQKEENAAFLQQLKEVQSELSLTKKDNLLKTSRRENDYKILEDLLESTKKQFNESKSHSQRLQADFSKLKIEHEKVINKFNGILLKTDEEEKNCSEMKKKLDEKVREIEKLQSRLRELEKAQPSIEKSYFDQLQNEKEKHAENIKKFKEESEKILMESQQKLIEEMEIQKHEFIKKQKILIAAKDENIITLEKRVTELKSELSSRMDKLQEYKACLDQANHSCSLLQKQLDDKGSSVKTSQSKVDELEKIIADLKEKATSQDVDVKNQVTVSKGNARLVEEKDSLQKQLENTFLREKNNLIKEWSERERALERKLSEEKNMALKQLEQKYEAEMKTRITRKDGEINDLKTMTSELNFTISKLTNELGGVKSNRNDIAEEMKATFEREKQKLLQAYKKDEEELRVNLQKGKQHEVENMLTKQQNTIKSLRKSYETAMDDLRKEHSVLLNAMKSQLTVQNENEMKKLKEENQSEKERLQNFLNLQSQEKIKQISNDFNNQHADLKIELERSRELRQKEFAVHTNKIKDLMKNIEDETAKASTFHQTIVQLEEETKTLRQELDIKVQEILEVRRECNSRMRLHSDETMFENRKKMELLQTEHINERQQMLHEVHEEYADYEERINAMKQMLEEAEERFRQRPSRDEDLHAIKDLQQRVFEQEVECQKLNEERKLYRLELVNREENFNKVFKTTPNVGFMNPIDISNKRKSGRKK